MAVDLFFALFYAVGFTILIQKPFSLESQVAFVMTEVYWALLEAPKFAVFIVSFSAALPSARHT